MRVFTYQSNLSWIGRKFLFALYLMVSSNLFGEGWTIQTSNNNGYDAYNIIASSYGDDGGFHIFGSNVSGFYQVSVAFTDFGDPADDNGEDQEEQECAAAEPQHEPSLAPACVIPSRSRVR